MLLGSKEHLLEIQKRVEKNKEYLEMAKGVPHNYYFEREMIHEDRLPDIPFTRPWKTFNLSKFKKDKGDDN